MKEKMPSQTISDHKLFLMTVKETQGYFINQPFVRFMVGKLKEPVLPQSNAAYLQSSEGIQEQIKITASEGNIDMTYGDKENNFVNWVHIADGIGIELSGQFLFERLIEAHESRANLYEVLSEEKDLARDYCIQAAQKHREKASYFKGVLKTQVKS